MLQLPTTLFANRAAVATTIGEHNLLYCSRPSQVYRTRRLVDELAFIKTRCATGAKSGAPDHFGSLTCQGAGVSRAFPPSVITEVKAAACDNAGARAKGLSYYSIRDLAALIMERLSLLTLAPSTVWNILDQDAIKPWQYKQWIFPRDPDFAVRANIVLDLYQRIYQDKPLGEGDFVFSADEKPGLLLRTRCHPTVLPAAGKPGLEEFEYRRHGTATLLAMLDVFSGHVFHQTVAKSGVVPFMALVKQVVEQEPYRSAQRIFVIIDNGGAHHRNTFQARLNEAFPLSDYPEIIAVHLPKHASWINQVELFFSIVARKALPHFQCRKRNEMVDHLDRFIATHNQKPRPFNWRFTKDDLEDRMKKWPDPIPN